MRLIRRSQVFAAVVASMVMPFTACRDGSSPTGPDPKPWLPQTVALSNGATHDHFEQDIFVTSDFLASCIGKMVHVEGPDHLVIDVTSTPSGNTITRVTDHAGSGFFAQPVGDVRYDVYHFNGHTNTIEGKVTVVNSTAVAIFKSAAGDLLNLSLHYQLVVNANGSVVVDKASGVCP